MGGGEQGREMGRGEQGRKEGGKGGGKGQEGGRLGKERWRKREGEGGGQMGGEGRRRQKGGRHGKGRGRRGDRGGRMDGGRCHGRGGKELQTQPGWTREPGGRRFLSLRYKHAPGCSRLPPGQRQREASPPRALHSPSTTTLGWVWDEGSCSEGLRATGPGEGAGVRGLWHTRHCLPQGLCTHCPQTPHSPSLTSGQTTLRSQWP